MHWRENARERNFNNVPTTSGYGITVRNSPIKVALERRPELGNPRLLVPYAKTQCWFLATELLVLLELDEPADFCRGVDDARVEGAVTEKIEMGSSVEMVEDEATRARLRGGAL